MKLAHAGRTLASLTAAASGVIALATALVALLVRIALAAQARDWLRFAFPPQHPSLDLALRIFTHNLRGLAALVGLALLARAPALAGRTPDLVARSLRGGGELLLITVIAGNVTVVGAALGGYGARMLLAALPQAPFELAAYSLALAGYLQQRQGTPGVRAPLAAAGGSVALLALAALLESFVPT